MNEPLLICISGFIGYLLYKMKDINNKKIIFEEFLQNYSHRYIDEEKRVFDIY